MPLQALSYRPAQARNFAAKFRHSEQSMVLLDTGFQRREEISVWPKRRQKMATAFYWNRQTYNLESGHTLDDVYNALVTDPNGLTAIPDIKDVQFNERPCTRMCSYSALLCCVFP
jgi:hypothetical protein